MGERDEARRPAWDLIVENAHLATMVPGAGAYGAIMDGAVAVGNGRIAWVGPRSALPSPPDRVERLDAGAGWVTPGLIDGHTHLVFGGDRVGEFEARLQGVSYEELAQRGGGILSTVRATRAADADALEESGARRLEDLARLGVTTVEIKSGYGLDVETEMRMLEVARRLEARTGVRVVTTLLAAHALPPEFAEDRAGYLDLVCGEMIPEAVRRGLADAVDAFCEEIAFSAGECGRVFRAAADHGLPVRLHADQRTDGGGAALAARCGARSADHLEHASTEGVRAMAGAGTTAVLLPGAAYFLKDPTVPPVAAFREHGVPMAVATDLNPGSSPLRSPLMAMNMACTLFGLTPEESLRGMTAAAAPVLGLGDEAGTLQAGRRADLVAWDVEHPAELAYWMGGDPVRAVVRGGRVVE